MPIFTDTYIKELKPLTKRYEKYEKGGFGIRVTTKGVKTWIYRYKINGKTDKLTLGHYPTTSLANAKKQFMELRGLRKDGHKPKHIVEANKLKESNTVEKLFLAWYENYAAKHRKKPLQIKQQIDSDIFPSIGSIPLDKIQTIDITKALDKIVERGAPIHANRVLSTIKQAFNYGVSRGSLPYSPAISIRTRDIGGLEKRRERFLTLNEIKQLWLFLDSKNHKLSLHIKNAIKILLLTGVRTSELRLAEWNEFNFEESLWIMPAAHSKINLNIKIHLSEQVKALLMELKENNHSKYVLPGTSVDKSLTENALPRAIKRIQDRIGIPEWHAHDLRRTFSTQLGEALQVNPVVIEKCLGHKLPRIMATYNKNEMLLERKAALNQWAEYIENLVLNSNVIPLKHAI